MGVEGGNFYEDAIIRQQNLEQQEEQVAIDERLQEPDTNHGQQEVGETSELNSELQSQVESILGRFEGLAEQKELNGFDVFQQYMLSANSETQNLFIDRSNMTSIFNVVQNSGRFPVNEFEFHQSLIEGTVFSDNKLEGVSTDLESKLDDNTGLLQSDVASVESDVASVESDVASVESDVASVESDVELSEIEISKSLERTQAQVESIRSLGESTASFDIPNRLKLLFNQKIDLPEVPEQPLTTEKISSFTENLEQAQQAIESVSIYLASNRVIETQILPQAQAQGPEVYRQVVESLAPLHPSFQARIDAWEMTPETFEELPPEQMVRVSGALGTRVDDVSQDADKSGNIFTIDGVDGTQVSYDVVTNERSVTLDGYTIEANADDPGDYQTPKLAYMRVEQKHKPKFDLIVEITEYFQQREVGAGDDAEMKAAISERSDFFSTAKDILGIDFLASDLDGIQIQTRLGELALESRSELKAAREEYRNELIQLRNTHAGVLAARDKRVKSTLSLLQGTGVTQMPQSVFMQVAETVNLAPAEYGFQTQIDLENGVLGFDASGDNENIDRVQFAEMVNVMLGVEADSEYAVNSKAVNGIGNTAISNRSEFNTYVAEESGWHEVGAANTILQRLKNRDTDL